MTEITRVPLKPLPKGSLTKLWLGIFAAIAIGAVFAVAAAPINWNKVEVIEEVAASEPGEAPVRLTIETIREGEGDTAKEGDVVFVKYRGLLAEDETVFDEYRPVTLPIEGVFPEGTPFPVIEGQTIDGFFKGLQRVRKGGEYKLFIPAELGYGNDARPGSPIPPGADLIFELEVMGIMSQDQFEVGMGILQQAFEANRPGPPTGVPQGAPVPGE